MQTNLVHRPSAQASEIPAAEFTAAVPELLGKIAQHRPRVVCFVGKGIWDSFARAAVPRVRKSKKDAPPKSPFVYDLQPYKVVHAEGALSRRMSGLDRCAYTGCACTRGNP